jgi:hypothetical protein
MNHYKQYDDAYEAIKVIENWNLDFCLGNVLKYIARHKYKGNELEDLKKAMYYLQRKINSYDISGTNIKSESPKD